MCRLSRKGHWKRDCPKLNTKDNYYIGKVVEEANIAKCDDEELDFTLATSSTINASYIWLLDSACSHHITPHREWFRNFEKHEVVYTAEETPLKSKGFEVRAKAELRISSMAILGEAVSYACHLVNSFPSTAIDEKTSFEKWYGKPATDYDSLQVFVSLHVIM
ncbi:hypothetical protein Tco_1130730 [Tanacetum coccineum]